MNRHDVARYLQVKVWELRKVPRRYVREAEVIIGARRGARAHTLSGDVKLMPVLPIDPFGESW